MARLRIRIDRCQLLPPAVVRGLLFLLLAMAIACSTVQAGMRYFYCEGFGASLSDPCAQGTERRAKCPFDALERAHFDCCARITMPSMPDGARASEPTVAPAGLVAIAPAFDETASGRSIGSDRAARFGERWRKPPRASSERQARLMVFLT